MDGRGSRSDSARTGSATSISRVPHSTARIAFLPPAERARLTNLSRIVTPKDSISRNRLPTSELENDERMYWLMADPLWATSDNEGRNEFLSRAVFAELRFSVEEFGIHGIDTDRGDVYVRYGPPPAVISFPPDALRQGEHRIRILWWYSTQETFLFRQLPTYGVATLDPDDARETQRLRDTVPVAWTNAGAKPLADSINVALTRFRASADSSDVYFAAELPVKRMVEDVDLARGALDVELEAYTWRAKPVFTATSHETIDFAHPDINRDAGVAHATAGGNVPLSRRGAAAGCGTRRAIGEPHRARARRRIRTERHPRRRFAVAREREHRALVGFPDRAERRAGCIAENRSRCSGRRTTCRRWPTAIRRTTSRSRCGSEKGGGLGALAAKIIGGVKSAIGISGNGSDHISLSFPRQTPARDRGGGLRHARSRRSASPGNYVIDVDITDLATHRHVSRERPLTIVE